MNNVRTGLFRATQIIWYIFFVVEALLLFRFVMKLLGANPNAGFTELIYGLSAPLVAPFQLVFGTPQVDGSVIEWGTLLALIVYWVIAWGIVKLIAMNRPVSDYEANQRLTEEE